MTKSELIQKERQRLANIFADIDDKKKGLIDKLIDQAAFISVENAMLQEIMIETGMLKIHPMHKDIQKPIEAAKQYRQNTNSYAVIIKTLNSILSRDSLEGDDPFDEWLRSKQKQSGTEE